MNVAVAVWEERISPMLDVAGTLAVFDVEENQVVNRHDFAIEKGGIPQRVSGIAATGVSVLICGAVSNPMAFQLQNRGIELVPWVTGSIDEVIEAYLSGNLSARKFTMPGCRRARGAGPRGRGGRRQRRGHCRGMGNRQW